MPPEFDDKARNQTPRTDAFARAKYDNSCAAAAQGDAPGVFGTEESPEDAYADALEFARQLERELAEAHARLEIDYCYDDQGKRVPHPTGKVGGMDGIACRDETIKMLERELAEVPAQLSEHQINAGVDVLLAIDATWSVAEAWDAVESILRAAIIPSATRESIIEECAKAALGVVDSPPVSWYATGRTDAATDVRALKRIPASFKEQTNAGNDSPAGVAESQAPSIRDGDAGVAPGRSAASPAPIPASSEKESK